MATVVLSDASVNGASAWDGLVPIIFLLCIFAIAMVVAAARFVRQTLHLLAVAAEAAFTATVATLAMLIVVAAVLLFLIPRG